MINQRRNISEIDLLTKVTNEHLPLVERKQAAQTYCAMHQNQDHNHTAIVRNYVKKELIS